MPSWIRLIEIFSQYEIAIGLALLPACWTVCIQNETAIKWWNPRQHSFPTRQNRRVFVFRRFTSQCSGISEIARSAVAFLGELRLS